MFGSHSTKKIQALEAQSAAISRSQAMIEFALDGTIITANENFLRTMGYTLDEIVGQATCPVRLMPADRDRPGIRSVSGPTCDAASSAPRLFKRIAKDGREVWLQATLQSSPRPRRQAGQGGQDRRGCDAGPDGKCGQALARSRRSRRSQAVIAFGLDGTIWMPTRTS